MVVAGRRRWPPISTAPAPGNRRRRTVTMGIADRTMFFVACGHPKINNVLNVDSRNLNAILRYFCPEGCGYLRVDLQAAPVMIWLSHAYQLPFAQ